VNRSHCAAGACGRVPMFFSGPKAEAPLAGRGVRFLVVLPPGGWWSPRPTDVDAIHLPQG